MHHLKTLILAACAASCTTLTAHSAPVCTGIGKVEIIGEGQQQPPSIDNGLEADGTVYLVWKGMSVIPEYTVNCFASDSATSPSVTKTFTAPTPDTCTQRKGELVCE